MSKYYTASATLSQKMIHNSVIRNYFDACLVICIAMNIHSDITVFLFCTFIAIVMATKVGVNMLLKQC